MASPAERRGVLDLPTGFYSHSEQDCGILDLVRVIVHRSVMSKIERQKHLLHGAEPNSTITRKLQHHFSICSLNRVPGEKLLPEAADLGEQVMNLPLTLMVNISHYDRRDGYLTPRRHLLVFFFSLSSGLPPLDD